MDHQAFVKEVSAGGKSYHVYDINRLAKEGLGRIDHLPYSIRILVENLLRKLDGRIVREQDLKNIVNWQKRYDTPVEIPHHPARVLMQDFTGVPAVVDLAAMRDAMKKDGGRPQKDQPAGSRGSGCGSLRSGGFLLGNGNDCPPAQRGQRIRAKQRERYKFLKWAQKSFDNFSVVPPRSGICHQVNLEYLGKTIITEERDGKTIAYPDSLVGLDSHTTMINGIGVMGWGVGGIEAEAVMLGQPYYMSIPEVIGVRMTGSLNPGVTATDMVLRVTEMLREYKVVEKFVEFFGPGMKMLSIPDRATIANMSPEYGATMGFFPVDEKTVDYLKMTDRTERAEIVEACTRELGLFYTGETDPEYTDVLELDLSTIKPAISGPARPQDRIELTDVKEKFANIIGCQYDRNSAVADYSTFIDESGSETRRLRRCVPVNQRLADLELNGAPMKIGDGSIVIAAITSCTNTSNPSVLIGAGPFGKKRGQAGTEGAALCENLPGAGVERW